MIQVALDPSPVAKLAVSVLKKLEDTGAYRKKLLPCDHTVWEKIEDTTELMWGESHYPEAPSARCSDFHGLEAKRPTELTGKASQPIAEDLLAYQKQWPFGRRCKHLLKIHKDTNLDVVLDAVGKPKNALSFCFLPVSAGHNKKRRLWNKERRNATYIHAKAIIGAVSMIQNMNE